ncbi:hypothetical protein [Herbaspirillum sp. NPDC101397]|uniref:hypothetical protein n=1 Tax=Herbaspirillum sp. NPDC101397 TaxID=3364006 RepID=UPI00383AFC67
MAKTKRRNKAYKPRDPESILLRFEPWKVAAVMNPLESIVDQLEHAGTIDVAGDGQAVFKDHCDGVWYDSPVAIMGVVEAYEIHERRTGAVLELDALRRLANKLKYQMMIDQNDTKAARECLARIRATTLNMTAGYANQLIKDFQIMEAMEGANA